MHSRQAMIVVLVVVAIGVVALPASGDVVQTTNETAENTTAENETNMGTQLTAFLQASAAETNDSVESGMWAAGFERANESEQARLATDRVARIEQKLKRLRERNRTLKQRYENGTIPEPAYVAKTSQLAGRIAALRSSINDTENASRAAGLDTSAIERLRASARNVTTPNIPGVARGVASGDGPPVVAGPPETAGPPSDVGPSTGADSPGNASDGTDEGIGTATNGTERGAPGNATATNETQTPAETGNTTDGSETPTNGTTAGSGDGSTPVAGGSAGTDGPDGEPDGGGNAGPSDGGVSNDADGADGDTTAGGSSGDDTSRSGSTSSAEDGGSDATGGGAPGNSGDDPSKNGR